MVDVTDESENVKHGPFKTCKSANDRRGLEPGPCPSPGKRGHGARPAWHCSSSGRPTDRLDCHWMGGNVPGLQKALIQPQERFSVVLCREMFGRGWQERWACLEHGNVLRDLGNAGTRDVHGFLGRG